jgi:hypothetical protein
VLPTWLAQVADGKSPDVVTAELAKLEAERAQSPDLSAQKDFALEIAAVWTNTGRAWSRLLEGMVLARSGDVVAIFNENRLDLRWGLINLVFNGDLFPWARIRTHEFSWVAARVPAIMGLFLKVGTFGTVGLAFADRHAKTFDRRTRTQPTSAACRRRTCIGSSAASAQKLG